MQILGTSASDAKKVAELLNLKEWKYDTFVHLFKSLTEADVKRCASQGVKFFHGQVEPGVILYIPPGFTLGCASSAASAQSALKFSFLPSGVGSWVIEQISVIKSALGINASDAKVADLILDVVAVDQAQK